MPGAPAKSRDGVGWDVVDATAAAVADEFGFRMVAVYALGSLAHGGFAPLVSDVDVGVMLDEFQASDHARITAVGNKVRAGGLPLAERLSLFWGGVSSLSGDASSGRFPPLDRLDLLRHGVLVAGAECRMSGVEPTAGELLRGAADFALDVLGRPERRRDILDGQRTAAAGARSASKVALFPVRFLYTAQTGKMGLVDDAVAHYLEVAAPGPKRRLVEAAAGWRHRWGDEEELAAEVLLRLGVVPLYGEFVGDYSPRLRQSGWGGLADQLMAWGDSLSEEVGGA